MNKRHLGGWWRLWIIVSAAWLILIVGISIKEFRWPDLTDVRAKAISYSCTVYRGDELIRLLDHYTEEQLHAALRERKPGTENWISSLEECVRALDADYAAQRRANAAEVVKFAVVAGFLPPLAILLFGLAARWIWRGFRPQ